MSLFDFPPFAVLFLYWLLGPTIYTQSERHIHDRNVFKFANRVFTLHILYGVYQIHSTALDLRIQDPALWYVSAFCRSYWAGEFLYPTFGNVFMWLIFRNLGRGDPDPEEPFFCSPVAHVRHDPLKSRHTPSWTEWIRKNASGLFNVISIASCLFFTTLARISCRYQEGMRLIPKWTEKDMDNQCRGGKIGPLAIILFYVPFFIPNELNSKSDVLSEEGSGEEGACEKDLNEKGEEEVK